MKLYVVSKIGFTQRKNRHSSRARDWSWEEPGTYDNEAQVLAMMKEKRQAETFFGLQEAKAFSHHQYAGAEWREGEEINLEEFDIEARNKTAKNLIAKALLGDYDAALKALRDEADDINIIDTKVSKEKTQDEDDSDC